MAYDTLRRPQPVEPPLQIPIVLVYASMHARHRLGSSCRASASASASNSQGPSEPLLFEEEVRRRSRSSGMDGGITGDNAGSAKDVGEEEEEEVRRDDETVVAEGSTSGEEDAAAVVTPISNDSWQLGKSSPKLILLICCVLIFGVTNRVLYRISLVPMKEHTFFLAQFQNISYLVVYFVILNVRRKAGIITPAMLSINKLPLVVVGFCESMSQLLFMYGAGHLPGVLLPVINQTFLVWNLMFASVVLGTRFTAWQVVGAALVVSGVITASTPPALLPPFWAALALGTSATTTSVAGSLSFSATATSSAAAAAAAVDPKHVLACIACFAFPAFASTVKERYFRYAKKELDGQPLDIFVVNSFASFFQSIFVLMLLPLTLSLNDLSVADLPSYLEASSRCFRGLSPICGAPACDGAPLIPIAYVITNLFFNISVLK